MSGGRRHAGASVALASESQPEGEVTVSVTDVEDTAVEGASVHALVGGWRRGRPRGISTGLPPIEPYLPNRVTTAFCQLATTADTDTSGTAQLGAPTGWDVIDPTDDGDLPAGTTPGIDTLPFAGVPRPVDPLAVDQRAVDGTRLEGNWPQVLVAARYRDEAGQLWTGATRVPLGQALETTDVTVRLRQKVLLGPRQLEAELGAVFARVTGHERDTTIPYGSLTVWQRVPETDQGTHRLFAEVRASYQRLIFANPTRRPSLAADENSLFREAVRYPTVDAFGPQAGARLTERREESTDTPYTSQVAEHLPETEELGRTNGLREGVLAFDLPEGTPLEPTSSDPTDTPDGRHRTRTTRPLVPGTDNGGMFAYATAVSHAIDELGTRGAQLPLYAGVKAPFTRWQGPADQSMADADGEDGENGGSRVDVQSVTGHLLTLGDGIATKVDEAPKFSTGLLGEAVGRAATAYGAMNALSGFFDNGFRSQANAIGEGVAHDPNRTDRFRTQWAFDRTRPAAILRLPVVFDATATATVFIRGTWTVEFAGINASPAVREVTNRLSPVSRIKYVDRVSTSVEFDDSRRPAGGGAT